MKRKVTAIILALILLFSIILFQGCLFSCLAGNSSSTEEETRLLIGFRVEKFMNNFLTGIYADTKVFDIDDVTLTFCYGGKAPERDLVNWHIAMYVSPEDHDIDSLSLWAEDYKNISGFYMLAEKTPYDFNHGPFDMTLHYTNDLYFHYKEEWTVPKEYFSNPRGYFIFWVMPMTPQYTEDGTVVYRLVPQTDTGMRRVYYRVEGDKVKLAENDYELWGDASDWAGNDESEETGRNESGEN